MKHLKNLREVAHFWANHIEDGGKSSRLFFEGNEIYSYGYHFIIARHVQNERGENAVLFTERRYSSSTGKQVSYVRSAASHLNLIFVPDPANSYDANVRGWIAEGEVIANHLLVAKKPEKYLNQLGALGNRIAQYHNFYGLTTPETINEILSITNKEEYKKYEDSKTALALAAEKKAKKALADRHKKSLSLWLKGESNRLDIPDGLDYLRIRNGQVETSQQVELPIQMAHTLWGKIVAKQLKVGDTVKGYTVSEVGDLIKIGCHTFKADYLIQFGQKNLSLNNQ